MSEQVLYRKYRPKGFDEVIGQEHIVQTLIGGLSTGRIGHAYLFTGPRGTGKTTLARIFAKSLNCANYKQGDLKKVPCNKCYNCLAVNENRSLDLIEIDAASNRGIDEIRSLKESAQVAAPSGGYKVFIIDEVHMLTKDAFNALLKILEEPPAHVIFIMATTEPQKILATVLSRVQRFDFKRLTPKQILEKLKSISKLESINISDEGLKAISISSDGALRDAEVALSKVRSFSNDTAITVDNVSEILGLIPFNYHPEFLNYLANGDKASAIYFIQRIYSSGVDLEYFTKDFIDHLRKVLVHRVNPATLAMVGEEITDTHENLNNQKLIKMINAFSLARSSIKFSPIPQLPLELAVLEILE